MTQNMWHAKAAIMCLSKGRGAKPKDLTTMDVVLAAISNRSDQRERVRRSYFNTVQYRLLEILLEAVNDNQSILVLYGRN